MGVPTAGVLPLLLDLFQQSLHLWPEPKQQLGVLFVAFPQRLYNVSADLPPARLCTLYGKRDEQAVNENVMTVLSAATLAAALLREQMASPRLPMALATDPSIGAFLASRGAAAGASPWDLYVGFDTVAALRRLKELRSLHPQSVRIAKGSLNFLWKLAALLLSPFERTVYLDADMMVLSSTLASDLLHNSLRTYDVAMPIDIGRLGNLDDQRYRTRRSRLVQDKVLATAPKRHSWQPRLHKASPPPSAPAVGKDGEQAKAATLAPPVFSRGQPPMCSCMMAYKRVPKVRRFLLSAAARLLGAMHPTDPTNQSIKIRQSDQEMMWFELHRAGDPSSQPAVLLLPEEFYCPVARGSRQAIDFVGMLNERVKPWWGYYTSRVVARGSSSVDRYVMGAVKDCHAAHIKVTDNTLRHRWKVDREVPWLNLNWLLQKLPIEMFCAERRFLNITPGCSVPANSTLAQPLLVTDGLSPVLPPEAEHRFARCATGSRRFCYLACKVNGRTPVSSRETFLSPIR